MSSRRAAATEFCIDRPRNVTTRPSAIAASTICWIRWMWLEKHAATTIPGAFATMSRRIGPTLRSLMLCPGSSAFVESDSKTCTPRPASSANPWRSVANPSIGVGSSLKSPVCSTVPEGVSTATASPSGIEWVTWRNRIENPSISSEPPGSATIRSASAVTPCSSSLPCSSSSVKAEPITGTGRPRSFSRYGSAPTWSSCPWVSTTAATASARSRTNSMSGRTRSMPGMSADGNDSPTSRISRRPSTSRQAMLRPTSPMPPRKMSRQVGVRQGDRRPRARPGPGRTPARWRARAAGGSARRCDPACRAPPSPGSGWT